MTLRQIGAVVICALALMTTAAEAKHRHFQARHDSQVACLPFWGNLGHLTCAPRQERASGHAKAARDANGNALNRREAELGAARGYCRRDTAAGQIIIDCDLAYRMAGFIADAVARGFKGKVHCFSLSHSHVTGSLHFTAQACDFAQRGWGKTVAPMYHVADLAAKWGLRDGCTFRDCGHIDAGRAVASRSLSARRHGHRHRHRMASR